MNPAVQALGFLFVFLSQGKMNRVNILANNLFGLFPKAVWTG